MSPNTRQTRPNFLVAGAAKSGTTSLCHYLRQHPDVFMAREKESHYFAFPGRPANFTGPGDDREMNRLVISDLGRYLECFDTVRGQQAVGEGSVYYIYRPESLQEALKFNPEMRFIVILREPLERAYSAFSHHRRDSWEPLTDFGQAIAAEQDRIRTGWSFGWHYRQVSDYATQLRAADEIIPAGQLRVVLYDDLVAQPEKTLQSLFGFLGVDDTFVCDTSLRMNVSGNPRHKGLNAVLSQTGGGVKELAKKLLPYEVGQHVKQRLRNWNLQPQLLDPAARRQVEHLFGIDRVELEAIINRDLAVWPSRHA